MPHVGEPTVNIHNLCPDVARRKIVLPRFTAAFCLAKIEMQLFLDTDDGLKEHLLF